MRLTRHDRAAARPRRRARGAGADRRRERRRLPRRATPSVQRLGDGEITIEIHTVVREDALQLYGFATADERELFELLLGVSGVGPKVALAIVSGSTPAELRRAIVRDDVTRFEAIPGIGRKTAQRVVLELKEKLAVRRRRGGAESGDLTARDALVELGWSLRRRRARARRRSTRSCRSRSRCAPR